MKKTLTLVLALLLTIFLLTACDGNGGGNSDGGDSSTDNSAATDAASTPEPDSEDETTSPTKQDTKVVKPSELITVEDAGRLLGIDLQVYGELDEEEQFGGLRSVYDFDDGEYHLSPTYMFQINIYQNELLDENDLLDKQMKAQGGISFFNNSLKEGIELIADEGDPMKTVWIEGIGDWASIMRSPIHTINFACGTYSMGITITGQATDVSRSKEEESAWKVEKLIEAAMLAVERLEAITK